MMNVKLYLALTGCVVCVVVMFPFVLVGALCDRVVSGGVECSKILLLWTGSEAIRKVVEDRDT